MIPSAGHLVRFSTDTVGIGGFGGLDFEPQQYYTATPTACTTTPCSNLAPFVRYDGYLVDRESVVAPTTSPMRPFLFSHNS